MNHKWLKRNDSTFAKDPSLKELSKEKAFEHSTDQVSIGFKAIDKKKIIFKRDEILKDASLDEISQQKTKLSQDEIDYLDDKNSSSRLEESKIRHKKTPAISLKNNFLSAIKDLNLSNRNDAGKKIKYPKHDSSQIKTHGIATNNEQISNTPSSQNDATLAHTGMNAPNYVDQRREIPRQGFTNISAQHQNNYVNNLSNEHKQINTSVHQIKGKQDERITLSQDLPPNIINMDGNCSNFIDRKSSANYSILDFTMPNNQSNRNFKQKMVRSLESNDNSQFESNEYMKMNIKHNEVGSHDNQINPNLYLQKHSQQYSSSSRGGMGIQKTNYSLSPNHTKVPSNNSGGNDAEWMGRGNYKINSSLMNNRAPGVFHQENQNLSNKFAEEAISCGYDDQAHSIEAENQFQFKGFGSGINEPKVYYKVESRNSQKLFKSSDTDEARLRRQNMAQALTGNDQSINASRNFKRTVRNLK